MRKFKLAKLVRDKIKDRIIKQGNKPNWRYLSDKEFLALLKEKIQEEASEILDSNDSELISELADLQEVITSLVSKISTKKEFAMLIKEKRRKSGSYKKQIFIDSVEATNDSEWIKYYLKSPAKFPEIKTPA